LLYDRGINLASVTSHEYLTKNVEWEYYDRCLAPPLKCAATASLKTRSAAITLLRVNVAISQLRKVHTLFSIYHHYLSSS
jgi:hypothetical protein